MAAANRAVGAVARASILGRALLELHGGTMNLRPKSLQDGVLLFAISAAFANLLI